MTITDPTLLARSEAAGAWFTALRDDICARFEALEDEAPQSLYPGPAGRFVFTPWRRGDGSSDQGGGVMGLMHGRFFEKVGVHISTVHGQFSPEFAAQVRGAETDPRFRATGISLIAHLRNPHCPAAHMNTRYMATTVGWFGGGGDLNPTQDYQRSQDHTDAKDFHAAFKATCDRYDPDWFGAYKDWCDRYFYLPHRNEHRGVGGIFYDHHATPDWDRDFAFTQDVGRTFAEIYPTLLRRHMHEPWSVEAREEQCIRRGRYVEFNLLYDRGTVFGLKTGGNIDSILSSMPPEAKWP